MAKKKQDTQQTQNYANQATFGQITPNDTPDTEAYRAYRPEIDPSIAYGAAESKRRLNSSFINPLGGNTTAGMKDAILRAGNRGIDQDASQAFRLGQYDQNQQRGGQLSSLAALTSPRIVQTASSGSGSGTSNTTMGNNLFGDALQVGSAAGQVALG